MAECLIRQIQCLITDFFYFIKTSMELSSIIQCPHTLEISSLQMDFIEEEDGEEGMEKLFQALETGHHLVEEI